MKYICPNCKVTFESEKKQEFCICGGRLQTPLSRISELFQSKAFSELTDLFGMTKEDAIREMQEAKRG